ncbi:hypothetical protein CHS0354_029402 [Potamilus streckersoni]|uniref:RHD domain-containing protein n=1 Tax=Potamilus streckersoni TaxID=2493646 RepID=A0AAE0STK4_9BIVA|nr:hypothetical protein CHS0354_029402 [Potamilus streckersoni]
MAEKRKEMLVGECDLPSLELGKLIDLADPNQVNKFMNLKGLSIPRGCQLFMSPSEATLPSDRFTRSAGGLLRGLNKGTKDKHKNGNEDKQTVSKMQTDYAILPSTKSTTVSSADVDMAMSVSFSNASTGTESSFLSPELFCQTKREPDINTIPWVDHDKGQSGITFADGNEIVIEDDLEVIGDESNMFGEGLQQQSDEKGSEPKVEVKTEGYHRFRYISEMGNRGNKRTFENHDGKEFVSIHVTGYSGSMKVLMFCVDIEGKPHPFYLEGEHCVDGLFSDNYTVNQDLIIRIKQINIICPTHKKYKESLKKLRDALEKHATCHKWQDDGRDFQLKTVDKSKVRLRVEVRYENDQQSIVKWSDPIQDRKQGIDFKIHTVRDPSAPVSGSLEGNSVLIVTTNETNFPKNVDVVLFDNSGWEIKADLATVEIIKKCVVIFKAPPYTKDQDIKGSVTVSLALHDRDTGKRTPPVNFIYYADSDIYGVQSKKRKLDSLQDLSYQNSSEIRTAGQANNRLLQVVKKKLGNKRRNTDATTSSAEMGENANIDTGDTIKGTLQDEAEVPNMSSLGFSQVQEAQELVPDEIAALLLQMEQFDRKTEAHNSEQDLAPVTKQPSTLSKGKVSVTSLMNGMLRVSYKGNVVGDVSQERWCQMLQKKRQEKYSKATVSTSLTTETQRVYPQQCLHESTPITSNSQNQNPVIGNQQSMEILAAMLEKQEQIQQLVREFMSKNHQQQSGDIKHESYDVGLRTGQQFSVMPQHHIPITLEQTEDYVFDNSGNAFLYSVVASDDGKYYLQPSSADAQQIVVDYQSSPEDGSQHYIIQDPSASTNMSLTFNQAATPTHQMIEGQPIIVQHIQQHPTDEYSPTDIAQFKQTVPWIQDDPSSSSVLTWQHVQASNSDMHSASPVCFQSTNQMPVTNSFQDHTYSDLPSSDLECDNKVQPGAKRIIINEDLTDNDLEYDTVPVPAVEVEV